MTIRRQIWRYPVTITQYTGMVVDEVAISATVTVDRQPPESSYLMFHFKDLTDTTGEITINGTETLTISNDKPKRSTTMYSSLTGITTDGLTGRVWVTVVNEGHKEFRFVEETLTSTSSPPAYMKIEIRDVRDVDIIALMNLDHEVITSHIGTCHRDLARVLNKYSEVKDYDGAKFRVVYVDRPASTRPWRKTHYRVALKHIGFERVRN